jgi:hypothetical protein
MVSAAQRRINQGLEEAPAQGYAGENALRLGDSIDRFVAVIQNASRIFSGLAFCVRTRLSINNEKSHSIANRACFVAQILFACNFFKIVAAL